MNSKSNQSDTSSYNKLSIKLDALEKRVLKLESSRKVDYQTTMDDDSEGVFAKSTSIAALRMEMLRELARLKKFMSDQEKK